MIEPTDEMVQAYDHASWENPTRNAEEGVDYPNVRAGLAAVFAIVERDYRIEPKPPWEREPAVGLCCIGYAPCQGRPGCNAATS